MIFTSYTVPPDVSRVRADKMLALAFPEHSRVALQRAFDVGLVLIGDNTIKRGHSVNSGDVLRFTLPEVKSTYLTPADIPLDVIWEDKHMIALNKASGMVVHPGAATGGDTLVHALLSHCAGSLSGVGGVERPGIVHRLDRETSGIILVAKNDVAHRGLSEQFATRSMQKEYLALVTGRPGLLSGIIDKPIGRNQTQRHKMSVADNVIRARSARTDWEIVESFGDIATQVRCAIHTGRTHQIRVHMKSLGHIILGDIIYGWKPDPRFPNQPGRVMLHAEHLVFSHPVSGKKIDLRAPIPKDMRNIITDLQKLAKVKPIKIKPRVNPSPAHVHEA